MCALNHLQSSLWGWPGLESASSKPRGVFRFAQSSPGHPKSPGLSKHSLPVRMQNSLRSAGTCRSIPATSISVICQCDEQTCIESSGCPVCEFVGCDKRQRRHTMPWIRCRDLMHSCGLFPLGFVPKGRRNLACANGPGNRYRDQKRPERAGESRFWNPFRVQTHY